MRNRIFLSPPDVTGRERELVEQAFDSNYVAPTGPMIEKFERAFAEYIQIPNAVAVSSGTAALHLTLRSLDVGENDIVIAPSFTFVGGVAPISYLRATPVFVDVDPETWCMDPNYLDDAIRTLTKQGKRIKVVVPADILGQCAPIDEINTICENSGIRVVLDSAEALGATYKGKPAGNGAHAAIYSFNGNKIITTSGGGLVASNDSQLISRVRYFSTAARQNAIHYEHNELGYNYRMSNILAAIGVGQLEQIEDKIKKRRTNFELYKHHLSNVEGVSWAVEGPHRRHTRWLICAVINPKKFGASRNDIINLLEQHNIESRPLWKPMHLQPVFKNALFFGQDVSEELFNQGICLPSGSNLRDQQIEHICDLIKSISKNS